MLKTNVKIALRNIRKNGIFSGINIIGLALGMAACLLILEYVSFELSYDQYNTNSADLYRVYNDRYQNGKLIQHGTITYSGISRAMKEDYPEVADYSRVEPIGGIVLNGEKKIQVDDMFAVDNSFLHMFTIPFAAGNPNSALKEPYNVILSATLAGKLFDQAGTGNYSNLIGKTFLLSRDSVPYKITGIFYDAPENSHLRYSMLISYQTIISAGYKEADYDFKDSDFWHYIQLKHGTDVKAFDAKLTAFSKKYFQGNKVSGSDETFHLQPLSKAHLYSDFEYEIGQTGSATVVWGLLIIALFIIVIAWVNYINLATARSVERAREVGVRKVAGATKQQLVRQFLTESFLINFVALLLSLGLVLAVQGAFNNLLKHSLSLNFLFQKGLSGYSIITGLGVLVIAGIFISGFYPAFVLSSFNPVVVLKGRFRNTGKGIVLRKALVVGQFTITVALIIGSLVVYRQIKFMNSQSLGFNMDQMLIINSPGLTGWDSTFIKKENTFTEDLKQIKEVQGASTSWNIAGGETGRSFNVRRVEQDEQTHYTLRHTGISIGYISLYQIKLLAGREFISTDFDPNFGKVHNLVVNESATKLLGYKSPEEAIGRQILRGTKKWDIVGVIDNVHQKSLRFPVEPTMMFPAYSTNSSISVKVSARNLPQTIAAIKQKYDSFFPGNLFEYYFLDDHFNEQYKNDLLFGKVFGMFAGFAVLIACLGLFGLVLYATIQRTKEIGVRKVLGASISGIVLLLSRDFLQLVIIANVIAFPLAYWVMHNWLSDFAYRISISWWLFVLPGILALLLAFITVSFQAVKAALANPVQSLRSE